MHDLLRISVRGCQKLPDFFSLGGRGSEGPRRRGHRGLWRCRAEGPRWRSKGCGEGSARYGVPARAQPQRFSLKSGILQPSKTAPGEGGSWQSKIARRASDAPPVAIQPAQAIALLAQASEPLASDLPAHAGALLMIALPTPTNALPAIIPA